ncbi:MAG TPA: SpoIIE family protein phosphatase [Acidimicrobiia bacterium]|nr:SpoIIE family protein phosphatase [Acidimicrobiia bacterium]
MAEQAATIDDRAGGSWAVLVALDVGEGTLTTVDPDRLVETMAEATLRAVLRLTAALPETDSPQRFYEVAVETVVRTVGVDRASLLLFDPDGVMRFKAWHGLSDAYRAAVEGHTPWTPADIDARPILVPDVRVDGTLAEFTGVFHQEGIVALGFVPLVHRARLVGKFMLYYDQPHDFSLSEVAAAEVLAAQVALALERHGQREAERASAARLAGLQRVTAELCRAVTVPDVAAVALSTARDELGARTGSLCLLVGDELEIVDAVGYAGDVMRHWVRFPLAADLPASDAVRTGRPIFLRSPAERVMRYPVFASSPVVDDAAFAMIPLNDDHPIGCLVFGFPEPREFTPADEAFLQNLAVQCAASLGRAQLYEERERSRVAAAFLAEASAILGDSLDYEETLQRTADLAASHLVDWCAIHVVDEGRIVPFVIAHNDSGRSAAVMGFLKRYPIGLNDPAGVGAVIRTGRAEAYEDVTEEILRHAARTPEHLERLHRLSLGAAVTVPLTVRRRTIGALTLANQSPRPFGPGTPELAEELAGRVANAIDNARSYRQQARLSRSLQASLLPPMLPDIPGVELAARYAAGSAGLDVGGDFYDVFQIDTHRSVIVVGDVCGRGVDAATTASLVRHTFRSAALGEPSPGTIVAHLNEVLLHQQDPGRYEPRFCTAVVAAIVVAGDDVRVTLAVAGHPLPLVRRADGSVTTVGVPGSLVGVTDSASVSETHTLLHPGDALVCYTDGVTERRNGDTFYEIDRLMRTLAIAGGDADALAGAVEDSVLSFAPDPPGDDLAVLVLRVTGAAPS